MSELFDLNGKTAIVTGATRGLGKAMALGLARAGADLVVTGRKQEGCDRVAAEISEATGRSVVPLACHMGDWERIDALVEQAYERFGHIDVLVNNAAINPAFTPVTDITEPLFDKLLAVNLKGPVHLAGLLAPRMAEAGGGSIINIITIGAYNGGPGVGVYSASKAALLNMTRVMAWEWAQMKVRVNAVAPGPFLTDMMKGANAATPGFIEAAGSATLQQRVADPDEIAGMIVYLASDASSFVTGADFKIAGGMLT